MYFSSYFFFRDSLDSHYLAIIQNYTNFRYIHTIILFATFIYTSVEEVQEMMQ